MTARATRTNVECRSQERKRQALEDLAIYRAVSFRDLSDARFGGNDFAARRGISQLEQVRASSSGAKGGVREAGRF